MDCLGLSKAPSKQRMNLQPSVQARTKSWHAPRDGGTAAPAHEGHTEHAQLQHKRPFRLSGVLGPSTTDFGVCKKAMKSDVARKIVILHRAGGMPLLHDDTRLDSAVRPPAEFHAPQEAASLDKDKAPLQPHSCLRANQSAPTLAAMASQGPDPAPKNFPKFRDPGAARSTERRGAGGKQQQVSTTR